jgi:2'-5' RNA ligase
VARLSVAIWPPPEVVAIVSGLPRPPTEGVHWAQPQQWLVKLRPLGHVPDRLVGPLTEAIGDALAGAEPLRCTLGPATRRLGGQWLGVPVCGLDSLAEAVFEATAPVVPVTHPQPFQADLVLARGRVPAALAGTPVEGSWLADTVVLVADRSAPGRPRFTDLAEFALVAPPA